MSKIALFPGSFDPFTKGHESIVNQSLEIFDEIIIGVGVNTEKKYLFDLDKRIQHIQAIYNRKNRVSVASYHGLTVDFCKAKSASHIIRGLRNNIDFEYEKNIAEINRKLTGIETLFFLSDSKYSFISCLLYTSDAADE